MKYMPAVAGNTRYNLSQPEWVSVPAAQQRATWLFKLKSFSLNAEQVDVTAARCVCVAGGGGWGEGEEGEGGEGGERREGMCVC